jgi:hypothetical protein
VSQNKDIWNAADGVTNITTRLDAGENKWNEVATNVESKSANWENTYQVVDSDRHDWQNAYDIVFASQDNWNTAYSITLNGIGAISEALGMMSVSTYLQPATFTNVNVTNSDAVVMKAALDNNEDNWTSVYNTVRAFSGNWNLPS